MVDPAIKSGETGAVDLGNLSRTEMFPLHNLV